MFEALSDDKDKWSKIKTKIKRDPDLGQERTSQLWELFNRFPNVFAWHKGELGCCKYGEHIVDT